MKLLLLLLVVILSKHIRVHSVIKTSDASICASNEAGSAYNQDMLLSCNSGNCPFHSFADLLNNVSSNATICLATDVVLSSAMELTYLKNIAIIGHNNPAVQCGYSVGLHFASCHNVSIEGIIWNECGIDANVSTASETGLYIHNSSNFSFQNCTFQNSLGHLIVLLEVSGNVNINSCNFTHNNYKNHDVAIHYLSQHYVQLVLLINKCVFDYNEGASIVYLHHTSSSQNFIYLENSTFKNNQGVSVYILNHQLFINGLVLFAESTATDGGGLFVGDYANVIFTESSVVTFTKNAARIIGVSISVSNESTISFEQTCVILFERNTATKGAWRYIFN